MENRRGQGAVYDVFNRRIGRKIDTSAPFDMAKAVIERYVLDDIHNGLTSDDGGNVVLDFVDPDGSGAQAIAMSKRYLCGEAVDQLFAQEDLSKTLGDTSRNLWPLVDHLGTVRDLAKQDGTIATHFKYDSFGNVTSGDTSKTRYLFTSREFDTATKLQYNRARYYDAAVGRWISEDPLGFAAGDANVGRYVGNETARATDPSGHQEREDDEPPFYQKIRRIIDGVSPHVPRELPKELLDDPNLATIRKIIRGAVPNLPPREGDETTGILYTVEGHRIELKSGPADPNYGKWPASKHVEGKAAIWIREHDSKGGVVFHNHEKGTCHRCWTNLPTLLPKNAILWVIPPIYAKAPDRYWHDQVEKFIGKSDAPLSTENQERY